MPRHLQKFVKDQYAIKAMETPEAKKLFMRIMEKERLLSYDTSKTTASLANLTNNTMGTDTVDCSSLTCNAILKLLKTPEKGLNGLDPLDEENLNEEGWDRN